MGQGGAGGRAEKGAGRAVGYKLIKLIKYYFL